DESIARATHMAERLTAIETLQHPRNLSQMSDEQILGFDAVFFPGGHGPMVDLASNADVGRVLRLLHLREKTVAAVCHGPAAFLPAGSGRMAPGCLTATSLSASPTRRRTRRTM